jgi:hypothetical protein
VSRASRKIFQPVPSLKFHSKRKENAVRKVKIAFFLKMRYSWKFCSINYCRITISDHFYWFPFIKSVNITFIFQKFVFLPIYSLLKSWNAVAGNFRCFMYKKQSSKIYKLIKNMFTSIICMFFSSALSKFNKIVN